MRADCRDVSTFLNKRMTPRRRSPAVSSSPRVLRSDSPFSTPGARPRRIRATPSMRAHRRSITAQTTSLENGTFRVCDAQALRRSRAPPALVAEPYPLNELHRALDVVDRFDGHFAGALRALVENALDLSDVRRVHCAALAQRLQKRVECFGEIAFVLDAAERA